MQETNRATLLCEAEGHNSERAIQNDDSREDPPGDGGQFAATTDDYLADITKEAPGIGRLLEGGPWSTQSIKDHRLDLKCFGRSSSSFPLGLEPFAFRS